MPPRYRPDSRRGVGGRPRIDAAGLARSVTIQVPPRHLVVLDWLRSEYDLASRSHAAREAIECAEVVLWHLHGEQWWSEVRQCEDCRERPCRKHQVPGLL